MPLSVTEPMVPVPDCFVIVTVAPPVVTRFPLASLAVTVRTWVELPLAVMLDEVGVRVDWVASAVATARTATAVLPELEACVELPE